MRITKWHFPLNWNWQQWRLRISFWWAARLPVDGFSCALLPPLILCSPGLSQTTGMERVISLHFIIVIKPSRRNVQWTMLKTLIIVYLNLFFYITDWFWWFVAEICVTVLVVKANLGKRVLECQTILQWFKKLKRISWCCTFLWRSLLIAGAWMTAESKGVHACLRGMAASPLEPQCSSVLCIFGNTTSELHYHPAPERADYI